MRASRSALAAALAPVMLATPLASFAREPYGHYLGQTSKGRDIAFIVGPQRRLDMSVSLRKRCLFGGSIRGSVKTSATDDFKVRRDGRFRIEGAYRFDPGPPFTDHGVAYAIGHLKMTGRFRGQRAHGLVQQRDILYDTGGQIVGRCFAYIHTFWAGPDPAFAPL